MAEDAIKESTFISVNEEGQHIVRLVNSTSEVAGWIPANSTPVNSEGETIMAVAGELEVKQTTLLAGEDEDNNCLRVVGVGTHYKDIGPLGTPAGAMPNSSVVLGAQGSVGDLLERIYFVIRDATKAAVYLEDGLAVDAVYGVAGTAPTSDSSVLALTASTSFTATANQYMDCILWITYIPTNAGKPIKFMRRIVSHPSVTAATAFAPTVTHNIPAGATISGWGIRPLSAAIEIAPYNQAGRELILNRRSVYDGGFRLSVDSGVLSMTSGEYTW